MKKLDLPEGNWAEVRDLSDVRRGDTKAALKAMDLAGANIATQEIRLSVIAAAQGALIGRFVTDWSVEYDRGDKKGEKIWPVNEENLDDVRDDILKPLNDYVTPLLQKLLGSGPGDGPVTADPLSTAPSSTSASSEPSSDS